MPLHAAPPTATAQIGHGCVGMPVSTVAEFSSNTQLAAPVDVLSVPVGPAHVPVPAPVQHANGFPAPVQFALGKKVFVTQTDRPEFEIGSGVPNLQPGAVQSTPAGVEPDGVVPRLQLGPVHDSVKRLIAPAGVALSGTCEMPPPSDRLPQSRFFNGIVPARSLNVLPQVPVPAVAVKSKPDGVTGPPVVDVVDVDVLVLVVDVVDCNVVGASELDVDDDVLVDVVFVLVVVLVLVVAIVVVGIVVGTGAEVDDVVLVVVDDDDVVELEPVVDVVDGACVVVVGH